MLLNQSKTGSGTPSHSSMCSSAISMRSVDSCCDASNRVKTMHQRHRLYLKGKRKFVAEFDAVAFARAQRKLKMLMNWLMDKSDHYLAVFQRSNALCLTSDSSSTDSAYNKVPKLHSVQTDRQTGKNTQLRSTSFFEEYTKQRHTDKDIKLLHGVWSNTEIEHSQIIKEFNPKNYAYQYEDNWIEGFDPISKNQFLYNSVNGVNDSQISRFNSRFQRFCISQPNSLRRESLKKAKFFNPSFQVQQNLNNFREFQERKSWNSQLELK